MSIMSSQFEMSASQNGSPDVSSSVTMNALLTRTSRRPCSASTRSNSASTAASSRWSSATATPRAAESAHASTSCAVAPMVPGQRVVGLARRPGGDVDGRAGRTELERACPCRCPRLAPVTIATLPGNVAHASPNQTPVRCATASCEPLRRVGPEATSRPTRPRLRRPRRDGAPVGGERRPRLAHAAPTARRPSAGACADRAGELAPRADVERAERERQVERVARAPDRRLPREAVAVHRVAARLVPAREELVRHVQLEVGDRFDQVVAARRRTRRARASSSVMPRLAALPARYGTAMSVGQHRHLVAEQLHLVRGGADDERDRGQRRLGAPGPVSRSPSTHGWNGIMPTFASASATVCSCAASSASTGASRRSSTRRRTRGVEELLRHPGRGVGVERARGRAALEDRARDREVAAYAARRCAMRARPRRLAHQHDAVGIAAERADVGAQPLDRGAQVAQRRGCVGTPSAASQPSAPSR